MLFVYPNCDVEQEGEQMIHIKSEENLEIKSITVNWKLQNIIKPLL